MTVIEALKLHMDVCDIHVMRLNKIFDHLTPILPVQAEQISNLSDDILTYLDAMAYRFLQLQNTISEKIFPKILEALEEDVRTKGFIDIMNKLEKLGVLESVQFWRDMRDARNDVVHDYPVDDETKAVCINDCISKGRVLIDFYSELKQYVNDLHDTI